jgi:hypothetical protein
VVLSIVGDVELKRRYFWSMSSGGCYPVDGALGMDAGAVSPGAREACCRMGIL